MRWTEVEGERLFLDAVSRLGFASWEDGYGSATDRARRRQEEPRVDAGGVERVAAGGQRAPPLAAARRLEAHDAGRVSIERGRLEGGEAADLLGREAGVARPRVVVGRREGAVPPGLPA